jgi:hypothetical protein
MASASITRAVSLGGQARGRHLANDVQDCDEAHKAEAHDDDDRLQVACSGLLSCQGALSTSLGNRQQLPEEPGVRASSHAVSKHFHMDADAQSAGRHNRHTGDIFSPGESSV